MPLHPATFPEDELNMLRDELRQSGLDSFQAAQAISVFLAARGYGVSNDDARASAARMEALGCTVPALREELVRLAWVM